MAQAHDNRALDLLEAAGGVDGLAHVMGGAHLFHLHPTGLGIDCHNGRLSAVHPHDRGTLGLASVHRGRIKNVRGPVPSDGGHRRLFMQDAGLAHIIDMDTLVRVCSALDVALSRVFHLSRIHLEFQSRQTAKLVLDVCTSLQDRIAGVEGGAGGGRCLIVRRDGGIHRRHTDFFQIHTQRLGCDLGQRRGDALSHLRAGGHDVQRAVLVHLHQDRRGRGGSCQLVEAGDALAAEVALFVHPAVRQGVPVHIGGGAFQTLRHRHGLHGLAGDAGVSVPQHVFQAQLQRVHPQPLRDQVHLTLVGRSNFRHAKTAVSGTQRLVCHVHIAVHLGVGQLIGAVGSKARVVIHPGIGGHVGAGIPLDGHLLSRQRTVPLHAGFDMHMDGRAADGGGKLLVPPVSQLHRAAFRLQGQSDGNGLAANLIFASKAAANFRDGEPHLFQRHMEGLGQQAPDAEGGLAGRPNMDLPGHRVRLGRGSVRLNGGVLQHPAGKIALHDLIRLGEALLHVSLFEMVLVSDIRSLLGEAGAAAIIPAPVLMDENLVFHRGLQVIHHRQQLVFHLDKPHSLMGQFLRVGGHRRHRFALIAHLFLRHDGLVSNERPVKGGKI